MLHCNSNHMDVKLKIKGNFTYKGVDNDEIQLADLKSSLPNAKKWQQYVFYIQRFNCGILRR